jgi:sugar lactone lactonase YvrE
MLGNSPGTKTFRVCAFALAQFVVAAGFFPAMAADRSEIVVADPGVFPESITSSADGAVFFGSLSKGAVYRAAPGTAKAEAWIKPGSNGLLAVLGVLADDKTNTLWVCSSAMPGLAGAAPAGKTSLVAFNLKTAALKTSYVFPGGSGFCNDIAIAPDGTVYATETSKGMVLVLKPGATALKVWSAGPLLESADGITLLDDGAVYVNGFNTGTLARIPVEKDGSAGKAVKLQTSQPLTNPDGMRSVGPHTMLLAQGKGEADEVTISGNNAELRVLKDGIDGPTAVTRVGNSVFILEARLRYMDPKMKGQDPGPFRALSVPYTGK